GLDHLHNNGIIHRDLHSRNILINNGNALITDFGISRRFNNTTASISSAGNKMIGMMAYIEPQCYIQHGIKVERKEKSDIYSLGVLLWELTSGIPPFNGYNFVALSIAISNNKREKPINGTPIDFVNLYEKCWSSNPDMRPAMNEILAKIKSLTE
ncbi:kinase-like domain-containing protein, partial [Gigaspora rosea]